MNLIAARAWDALNTFWPVELLDSGIADVLCLETYEHGTSPSSYDSILLHGVDPQFGGSGGETAFVKSNETHKMSFADMRTVNRFFVFNHNPRFGTIFPSFFGPLMKNVWIRKYSIMASIAQMKQKGSGITSDIKGFCLGFSSPIIKLRFQSNDPNKKFENDDFFEPGFASYTEQKINVDHIGIRGSFIQGLNKDWMSRIKKQPSQCLWGVIKLTTAIALIALGTIAFSYTCTFYLLSVYLALKSIQATCLFVIPFLSRSSPAPIHLDLETEAKIINDFIFNVTISNAQPEAILFSGCSGSGKTTERIRLLKDNERKYVVLDSDQIMEKMPEYRRLIMNGVKEAASIMHMDSLRLRAKIMKQAIKERKSIVLEGTGSNFVLYKEIIKNLRSQNYRIKLIRCEIELEEAKKRVRLREQQTGRHVPEQAIEFSYSQSLSHLDQLRVLVDEYQLIRN